MRENYGPPVGAAIVWDSLSWLELVERFRGLANLRDATIIFGRDPGKSRKSASHRKLTTLRKRRKERTWAALIYPTKPSSRWR
jgi:hypothetical protein